MSIARGRDKRQTVEIKKIVSRGEGLFHTDGRTGFVPFVLPGEEVTVSLSGQRAGVLRGEVVEVTRRSPDRREPRCPVFTQCGGCDWQHIDSPAQLRLKEEILRENLRRLGGIDDTGVPITVVSGPFWGYRSRVQVHRSSSGGTGFHARRSHRVVPVTHCPVATDRINDYLAHQGALREDGGLPAERTILVEGDDGVHTGHGDATVQRTVGGIPLEFHPGSFFQSNSVMLEELAVVLRRIMKDIPQSAGTTLVDLYAGAGVLSALAVTARGDMDVQVVEADRRNGDLAAANLQRAGVPGSSITVHRRAVESVVDRLPLGHSTVIADPPRRGLPEAVHAALCGNPPPRMVYLSCDPASLARDLGRLRECLPVRHLYMMDFYPQTAQIETLAVLGEPWDPPS